MATHEHHASHGGADHHPAADQLSPNQHRQHTEPDEHGGPGGHGAHGMVATGTTRPSSGTGSG